MSRPWPDYGEPGAPGMDPYYISPERERRMEREAAEKAEKAEPVSFSEQLYGFAEFVRSSALALDDRDMIAAKFEDAARLIDELVKRAWPA